MSATFRADRAQQPNNFDFLRLSLAVLVLYSHCYPLGTGSEVREPIRRLTHGQMTGGSVAVDLFFVMSGFLITASAERSRSLWSYFKKRFARIYPAFLVAASVGLVVVLPLSGGSLLPGSPWWRAGDVLLQTLRLREFDYMGAFAGNPYPGALNGSLWSIQFEFWCYVGVALLLVCGLLRRRFVLVTMFAASVVVSVLFQTRGWVLGGKWLGVLLGSPQLWARLLPLYLAGVVFHLYRDRVRLSASGALVAAGALLAACFVPFGWTALFPLAGTYLAFWLAFSPRVRLYGFGRYGDFSYGTYLYAFPVEQLIMRAIGRPVAPWMLFGCALPVTLLMAAASWYGVERWFLRPGRRKRVPGE
jgi:peptidoglycan/LPS O-acetylase OafA/YrhL